MTFWRWLWFLIKVGAVAAAALWIADRPGQVSFVWLGYRVETSIGVLLAALVVLLAITLLLHRLWRLVWRTPRDLARLNQERKRQQGYRALSQGMAAVAAGDAAEAHRQAKLANKLLKDPPLILLLAAQTAQLGGDENAARRYFTAMREKPETSFLGLRGLLMQALKAGDKAEALALARRAYDERPSTPWAVTTLLDLQLEGGKWSEARLLLQQAVKLKALPEAKAKRIRAVILAEQARVEPIASGLDAARDAVKLAPDLVPARARLAELLTQAGRTKEATKTIEQGWALMPHPLLAAAYTGIFPGEDALARYRRFLRLVQIAPRHRESLLAEGECAIAAELWSEARKQLDAAASIEGERPSTRLCRLMIRLEESHGGEAAAARRWLLAMVEADPDPAWLCGRCGTLTQTWQADCPHCRAFDSLAWQAPQRAVTATLIGPAAALSAPGHGDHERSEAGAKEAAGHGGPQPAILPPTPGARAAPLSAPVDAARRVN
jgi:HemY protein